MAGVSQVNLTDMASIYRLEQAIQGRWKKKVNTRSVALCLPVW